MPRVAKKAATEETVIRNSELEVKDDMKANGFILVGTQFIPIVDGKVKVSAKLKEVLEKSGFLK